MGSRAHRIRNRPGSRIKKRAPKFDKRNFGGGVGAGAVAAGVATLIEDTVGVPFGGSVDTLSVENVEDGQVYTVNVNAPTQNMAEARAFIDAGTGFTALLTDLLDVRDVEIQNTRVLRDTYEVKLKIED